ncbi:2'-5' RNA ligase family protein [Arthrobacter cheniae]|uniref:2'-5' RNA ligase family protein n=1 Tax=Arthrobacter cheniae TaxID=1258888 RepID=A0A3A5M610_9MICC|nr:2'-5' RNA ligase family protein [Arthrobacter cheniae]RJT81001.1 2'-5' RNA ligase family protein [Arthrobacter cheniae]
MCVSTGHPSRLATALSQPGLSGSCVGITISIPEPLASSLKAWRASFGDPMAAVVPPHITLITTTPAHDWAATIEHVRAVAQEQRPFEVRLRSTGSFRPASPVVFLKLVQGFDECVELHSRLQKGPLERDLEFPFHPHVTVAHDVSDAGMDAAVEELNGFEAAFDVGSMGLYEHVPSGLWKLREELHFGEDADRPQTTSY